LQTMEIRVEEKKDPTETASSDPDPVKTKNDQDFCVLNAKRSERRMQREGPTREKSPSAEGEGTVCRVGHQGGTDISTWTRLPPAEFTMS